MPSGPNAAADRRLISVHWGRIACPLAKPYELSFATLTEFDSVWVSIADETGAVGLGEGVALPGYGWETADDVAAAVQRLLDGAARLTARELRARCQADLREHPFASSAVLAALDLPAYLDRLHPDLAVALNSPVSGDSTPDALADSLDQALERGCRYVKVKVGREPAAEKRNARFLLAARPDRKFQLVFDANQAYSAGQALALAEALRDDPNRRLLWFEQPVDRGDWPAMEQVCRNAGIPVVLDESIYSAGDIDRAKSIGAAGVKLKTFKNGGIAATLSLAEHARRQGLIVVFGNGVATDIGNFAEFLTMAAAPELFTLPSESSGFAKLARPVCDLGLGIAQGYRMTCRSNAATAHERLRAFHALAGPQTSRSATCSRGA